jgi:3-oxoacyl-[acyl-carrier protein] reductase
MELKGQCFIVTGGLSGIGEGITKLLKEQDVNVLVTTSRKELANNKDVFYWDMQREESTKNLISIFKDNKYDISGFVHCAHIFSPPTLLLQLKSDVLMSSVTRNFNEVFNLSKYLLKKMSRKKHGVILFLGSLISQKPHTGKATYIIEKNMLSGLVKSIHGDFYNKGVRASILHPGLVNTKQILEGMSSEVLKEVGSENLLTIEEVSLHALKIIGYAYEDSPKHTISYELAGSQKWW